VYFGVLPIPDLLDKNKELGDLLLLVHKSLNLLFVAVLAGHIGAALKHHFIDRDDILTRMLPRRSKEN
jgi:cytochrome b561